MNSNILFIAALKSELSAIENNIKKEKNYYFKILNCGLIHSLYNLNLYINEIKPAIIIHSGICGALYKNFKVTDIVFPTNVFLFENGYFYNENKYSYFNIVHYPEISCNNQKIINAAKKLNYFTGNFVSGNSAVFSKQKRFELNRNFNAVAVDMELFSVAFLCNKYNIKLFSVKVISDTIDDNLTEENNDIKKFIAKENFNNSLNSLANFFNKNFDYFFNLLKEGEL